MDIVSKLYKLIDEIGTLEDINVLVEDYATGVNLYCLQYEFGDSRDANTHQSYHLYYTNDTGQDTGVLALDVWIELTKIKEYDIKYKNDYIILDIDVTEVI